MLCFKSPAGACVSAGGGSSTGRHRLLKGHSRCAPSRGVTRPAASAAADAAVSVGTAVSLLGSNRAKLKDLREQTPVDDHLFAYEKALGYSFGNLELCFHVSSVHACWDPNYLFSGHLVSLYLHTVAPKHLPRDYLPSPSSVRKFSPRQ
jgi:hypothetical protein